MGHAIYSISDPRAEIFKGFVNGIPDGVLSGGRYDRLMQKMGKSAGAVGFAVYLDLLERFAENTEGYDIDTVILYDEGADLDALYGQNAKETGGGYLCCHRPSALTLALGCQCDERGNRRLVAPKDRDRVREMRVRHPYCSRYK